MACDAVALREAPKAELHVHLEGSASDAFWQRTDRRIADTVSAFGQTTDSGLEGFLSCMLAIHQSLDSPELYGALCADVLDGLIADGVKYAEITWAPGGMLEFHGVPPAPVYAQIESAIHSCRNDIDARVLVDLIRNQPLSMAERIVRWLGDRRPERVVGINVGGDEEHFPIERLAPAVDAAHRLGLGVSIHAGECVPEQLALAAIRAVRPHRVGHGTAIASEAGRRVLAAAGIHVEACPSSNVALGYLDAEIDHPVLRFPDIRGSLNTDDRTFFGPSLTDLMAELFRAGVSAGRLAALQVYATRDAFAAGAPALERVRKHWATKMDDLPLKAYDDGNA